MHYQANKYILSKRLKHSALMQCMFRMYALRAIKDKQVSLDAIPPPNEQRTDGPKSMGILCRRGAFTVL